ncbi:hypothetical protein MIND_00578700 [Mycena indigotica]|uniref:F-box domain-containing protein n=1 Tax=Mycena indigotica TaxID=2126181 RepID=A0A8H6W3D5_9AGAR|nr:uncharacterized protein MIND_00578700 [Mycena indigotica]KAF7303497.1 hypothetical protein MIND_00578700 [Mycena indigotica]
MRSVKTLRNRLPRSLFKHSNDRRLEESPDASLLDLKESSSQSPTHEDLETPRVSPISRLPFDVLVEIFLYVHGDTASEGSRIAYSTFECSRVCVAWRQLALHTPLLWSRINFDTPAWTRHCLDRAKSAPLIVEGDLASDSRGAPSVVTQREEHITAVLEDHRERIKAISLVLPPRPTERLQRALVGGFPILVRLHLRVKNDWSVPAPTPNCYPRLHTLCLNSPFPRILRLTGERLAILDLNAAGIDAELPYLLSLLTQLTTLKLTIRRNIWGGPPTPPHTTTSLPKLRWLFITDFSEYEEPSRSGQLLGALALPVLQRCTLNLWHVPRTGRLLRGLLDTALGTHFPAARGQSQRTFLRVQYEDPTSTVRCRHMTERTPQHHLDLTFRSVASDGAARELVVAWHVDSIPEASVMVVIAELGNPKEPFQVASGPQIMYTPALQETLAVVDTLVLTNWMLHWYTESNLWTAFLNSLNNLSTLVLAECALVSEWEALLGDRAASIAFLTLDNDAVRYKEPHGYDELDSTYGTSLWDRSDGFWMYMARSVGWRLK